MSASETTALHTLADAEAARPVVVLDTSVLVADPDALYAHPGCDVVLPLTVIEELDQLKTRADEAGAGARAAVRILETLRAATGGTLTAGAPLPDDATVRVEPNGLRLDALAQFHLSADVHDHRILASALGLAGDGRTVRVVSLDQAMRLKADALGLDAVDYAITDTTLRTGDVPGWGTYPVSADLVAQLYADGRVAQLPDYDVAALAGVAVNEFAVLRDPAGRSALARRTEAGWVLLPRDAARPPVWGIRPRNKEQRFALELLVDPDVPVVALSGRAGTGKTMLAIGAALEQTFETGLYDRVMLLRPMHAISGQDIGFLPGDVAEKVAPWFDAVTDTMVALSETGMTHAAAAEQLALWTEQGKLTMEPVTFLRGRSLQRTLVLVDEAQNLEQPAIKTVLTRLGEGSKIVLCGDPDQCDNPYTNAVSNGLTALVGAFRDTPLFGHIALTSCVRSAVADLAAERL